MIYHLCINADTGVKESVLKVDASVVIRHAISSSIAGAKLDVQLMKSRKTAGPPKFSRAMVLRRLHGRVGTLQNLQYRMHLVQVFTHISACFATTVLACQTVTFLPWHTMDI